MENDIAPEGFVFAVSETENHDRGGSYLQFFNSRSKAQAYYDELKNRVGWLYPQEGVRLITKELAAEWRRRERAWIDELQAMYEIDE